MHQQDRQHYMTILLTNNDRHICIFFDSFIHHHTLQHVITPLIVHNYIVTVFQHSILTIMHLFYYLPYLNIFEDDLNSQYGEPPR